MSVISVWGLLVIGTVGVMIVGGVAAAVYFLVKGASDKER